jgi:hypothetical protein
MPRAPSLTINTRARLLARERRRTRYWWLKQRRALGIAALIFGDSHASRLFLEGRWVAKYWRRKVCDPSFHPGQWGGFRYLTAYVSI